MIDFLRREEQIAIKLAAVYRTHGYRKFKMSSFEEYSLYLDNRDFLPSTRILTFGGADGRLLALRPDVTLSALKNTKAHRGATEKLFYNEKVYRAGNGGGDYKEVSQIGVEIIGDVDLVSEAEIIALILKTLDTVGENYILDLSDMGFVKSMVDAFGLCAEDEELVYGYLRTKNCHDFDKLADSRGLSGLQKRVFTEVVQLAGEPYAALSKAEELALNNGMRAAAQRLRALIGVLKTLGLTDRINVNFSIANNVGYYNGIIFNGYIEGMPRAVLSGGRYDGLAEKLGKDAEAIGFALYLGEIEAYLSEGAEACDIVLAYGGNDDAAEVLSKAEKLIAEGKTVKVVAECAQSKDRLSSRFNGSGESADGCPTGRKEADND